MKAPAVVLRPHEGTWWRPLLIVAGVLATAIYLAYARESFPHGGSHVGLAYGISGLVSILLLAFFGVRKRRYRSGVGTIEQWLQFHIYLGLLAVVVLLLHSGFRFHDRVALAAFVLVIVVVASGIVGAILYATIPRVMTDSGCTLSAAGVSEEINALAKSMAEIVDGRSRAFGDVHRALMEKTEPRGLAGWRLLFSGARLQSMESRKDLKFLIALVPIPEQVELRRMLLIGRQRNELLLRLMAQQRYKNMLEAWLYVHVPFTFALFVVAAAHIFGVFYYGAVRW